MRKDVEKMAKEVSINDIKEKFQTVQGIQQSLKEEKIKLDSEYNTLKKSLEEKVSELLEKTGSSSVDEAVKKHEEDKKKLEEDMASLSERLSGFLDTYGE